MYVAGKELALRCAELNERDPFVLHFECDTWEEAEKIRKTRQLACEYVAYHQSIFQPLSNQGETA